MDGQRSNMLTYFTCTHSRWFKHWGKNWPAKYFLFLWQKWTTRYFSKLPNFVCNQGCSQWLSSRNKFSVELQLPISVPQWYDALRLQTMVEKAESQRISLCSCVVSGTVYTHIQMFTFHCILRFTSVEDVFDLCFGHWIWRVSVPVSQISLFTFWLSVYLIGHIFIHFFWNWITQYFKMYYCFIK